MVRRRKATKKSAAPEQLWIKLLFYLIFIALLVGTVYALYLYAIKQIPMDSANTISSITLSLMFPFFVFSYRLAKGSNLKSIIQEVGLSRDKFTRRAITIGITLFLCILALEVILAIFTQITSVQLPTNVDQVLGEMPLYFLLFGVFIAPINEEIFFRGFLVPRLGIIPSSIIFAVLHAGYGSWAEFFAALIFGLLAGYAFKRTKSLYTSIIGHFLVNLLTISSIIAVGG